jgi:hypothetical protein
MTYRLLEVSIKDDLTSLLVILLVYICLSDDSMQASFGDDCIRICTEYNVFRSALEVNI